MLIRNGLRSTLRAKGRTALFTLLIFALTLILTLGAGLWGASAQLLQKMDESYCSVAVAEYMGDEYPDADAADESARAALAALDVDALSAVPGVTLWENTDQAAVLLEGYTRALGEMPYRSYGVVTVSGLSPMYREISRVVMPENFPPTCTVIESQSGNATLYAPDLPPLSVPGYIENGDRYLRRGVDGSDVLEFVVPKKGLPELFYSYSSGIGTLVGELPEGYHDGYQPGENLIYHDEFSDRYVLQTQALSGYTGRIDQVLYTRDGKDGLLFFDADSFAAIGFEPEKNKRYLLHGSYVSGNTSNRTFAVMEFYDGCETLPFLEISGKDDPALTDSLFAETAQIYRMANSAAFVTASDDVSALTPFQQGTLYLTDGRFPQAGEAGVCVLSGSTAQQLGVGVGDSVSAQMLLAQPENRYALQETEDIRHWQIVGVTNILADYDGQIWVSDAEGGFDTPLFGFTLGRAVLENRQAARASQQLEALLPVGVRLTLYDQGYTAAARPVEMMRTAAMAVTLACAFGALAVLLLFALLFVGRQRETVQILESLGTPKGGVRLWLLSGAGCIAGIASLLGAVAGAFALEKVAAWAMDAAARLYTVDTRYSDAAVGVLREADTQLAVPAWTAAAAGLAVFLCAMALCFVFLGEAQRENAPHQGNIKRTSAPKGKTSTAGRGALRFALLSARRGGRRSLIVPAVTCALTLLLGLLAGTGGNADAQLDTLYDTTALEGAVVVGDGHGYTRYTGLSVSAEVVQQLARSGLLSQMDVSIGWNYCLPGEMPEFGSGSFAYETMKAWVARQPKLIACSSLSATPAFYHSGHPEITWLDGWDESFLRSQEYQTFLNGMDLGSDGTPVGGDVELPEYPALAGSAFLRENGLQVGDTLNLTTFFSASYYYYSQSLANMLIPNWISLKIVGEIASEGKELYVPLSFWCPDKWLDGENPLVPDGERLDGIIRTEEDRNRWFYSQNNFEACRFTLRSARDLESFRAFLAEQNYSQLGKLGNNRTTILLWDEVFTETVGGLNRYAGFSRALLPALLATVGVLGFLISWLMIHGRRMEFAVLRGLGAPRGRVFASFFLEQALLCLPGCLAGALVLTPFLPADAVWGAAAGFYACYLAGCALSVAAVGRTKLMALLSERE